MKLRKWLDNLAVGLGALVLVAAIWFLDYGIKTDCPDTAIYVYCGKGK